MCVFGCSPLQRGGAVAANGESFRSTYFPDGANTITFEDEVKLKDNGFLVSALFISATASQAITHRFLPRHIALL